jgi:hypothetical protein
MMMTPFFESNPSISVRSWLSVCSRSSCAQRVELVDEDNARGASFGLPEQIAHARRADPDEHLHEFRAAETEKRNLGFARDGPRQKRLAGARWPDEQHAFGDTATQSGVLARVLEELDDLAKLFLRFIDAGDVHERHLDVIFRIDLGPAPRERHDAALGSSHPPEEEDPQRQDQQERNDPRQKLRHPAGVGLAAEGDLMRLQLLRELGIVDANRVKHDLLVLAVEVFPGDGLLADGHLVDAPLRKERPEIRVVDRLALLQDGRDKVGDQQQAEQAQAEPHRRKRPAETRAPRPASSGIGSWCHVGSGSVPPPPPRGLHTRPCRQRRSVAYESVCGRSSLTRPAPASRASAPARPFRRRS